MIDGLEEQPVVFVGSSPALVLEGGTVVVNHAVFLNTTDAPTILFYYQDDGIARSLSRIIPTTKADAEITDFDPDYPGAAHSWFSIQPRQLPTITDAVAIDGYSQPGAAANTQAVGSDAILLIELDGSKFGLDADGLTISTTRSTVEGLVINSFGGSDIVVAGGGQNVIAGNFIGTAADGVAPPGNGEQGVWIIDGARDNAIGGASPAARNIISGNLGNGVEVSDGQTSGNVIAGNLIGTDLTGTVAVANGSAKVRFNRGANRNRVGTDGDGIGDADERNVISGNRYEGVSIRSDNTPDQQRTAFNRVAGNYIGVDATGTNSLGNGTIGVAIAQGAQFNRIGTDGDGLADDAERNIIYIGIDAGGTKTLGNRLAGINIITGGKSNRIGTNGDGP